LKSRALFSPEAARGWIPWGALAPFLAFAFVVGPLLGIALALADFGLIDDNGEPRGLPGIYVFLLLPFAAIGLLVLGWVRFVERRPLATIGLTRKTPGRSFLRGLVIGCLTLLVVVLASWAAGGFEARAFGAALRSPAALLNIGILLLCFMFQASVEELVFRGWLLSAVARKFNVPLAVILSSLIFCLLHFDPEQSWLATANLALFALFACAWALHSGSIWGVMGWHVGWNWLLATGFELPVTGIEVDVPALLVALTPSGPQYLTGGATGPEASVFCGVFFVGALLVFWRQARAA
jgi:membrane protease YdiL (CAAX protease family)